LKRFKYPSSPWVLFWNLANSYLQIWIITSFLLLLHLQIRQNAANSFLKFLKIESILARERQNKSGVHPRLEIADKKTVRLILNLAMEFIQNCIQN